MSNNLACPPQQTLVDFMLGKLEPEQVENCAQHLDQCSPCGETIRGLDASDTLVGIADNIKFDFSDTPISRLSDQPSEQLVVKMLIDKMEEMPAIASANRTFSSSQIKADEVINLLQPSPESGSIGRLANYEIHEILGVGATSVVFRATDSKLHREVALKVLRPSLGEGARKRFQFEARAAAALSHDNIISIHEVSAEGRLAYMAQQWLPGETLEARMNRGPDLSIEAIKDIAIQVANGLDAAHSKNLIHRDIKPANIWIESERNRVIILDFGLVRVADDQPQMTETGMIAGTPNFMSPEQSRGSEVDARSDLFSLGCVLYRLLSGQLPFNASNTLATLQSIQNDEPQSPRQINRQSPKGLSDLAMILIRKQADDRPQTAGQLAEALRDNKILTGLLKRNSQKSKQVGLSNPPARFARWAIVMAAIVLGLGALAFSQPQIVRIMTNQGLLEIETDDPDVAIEVLQGGEVIHVIDQKTNQRIEIAAGTYKIRPSDDQNSFELSQDVVTMKRGGKVIVTVTKAENDILGTTSKPGQTSSENAGAEWKPNLSEEEIAKAYEDADQKIVDLLTDVQFEFEESFNKLKLEHDRLRARKGSQIVSENGMNVHEVHVRDLGRKFDTLKTELNSFSADLGKAEQALASGDNQIENFVWKLKQDGKVKNDDPLRVKPAEVLRRYHAALKDQISDLKNSIQRTKVQHQHHLAEVKRIANLKQEMIAIETQMDQVQQFKELAKLKQEELKAGGSNTNRANETPAQRLKQQDKEIKELKAENYKLVDEIRVQFELIRAATNEKFELKNTLDRYKADQPTPRGAGTEGMVSPKSTDRLSSTEAFLRVFENQMAALKSKQDSLAAEITKHRQRHLEKQKEHKLTIKGADLAAELERKKKIQEQLNFIAAELNAALLDQVKTIQAQINWTGLALQRVDRKDYKDKLTAKLNELKVQLETTEKAIKK